MCTDGHWYEIDPAELDHYAAIMSREEFRYYYPDLELPIEDQSGDKPEIRFGEYGSFPCIWDTEPGENGIHEAWIYVDDHWSKIHLEARTVWTELRPLWLGEKWDEKYPGVPALQPFMSLVESQNRRHVRH
jgi:hypothetical protein